jgi:hypothetical protein
MDTNKQRKVGGLRFAPLRSLPALSAALLRVGFARDHDAGARPPRQTKKGFAWAIARDDRPWGGTDPPAVVFHYAPGEGAKHRRHCWRDYQKFCVGPR